MDPFHGSHVKSQLSPLGVWGVFQRWRSLLLEGRFCFCAKLDRKKSLEMFDSWYIGKKGVSQTNMIQNWCDVTYNLNLIIWCIFDVYSGSMLLMYTVVCFFVDFYGNTWVWFGCELRVSFLFHHIFWFVPRWIWVLENYCPFHGAPMRFLN